MTWLPGVATNMTPLLTIGGASWPLITPVANTHAGCSRVTLAGVIWSTGLYPHPSYVRLTRSQSPSAGLLRRSAVTGL